MFLSYLQFPAWSLMPLTLLCSYLGSGCPKQQSLWTPQAGTGVWSPHLPFPVNFSSPLLGSEPQI